MRLLIYSDLHLDQRGFKPILVDGTRADKDADVVVLAGDIDEGLRGFRWARESFPDKPIVKVAGNHEFYGKNWTRHLDDMRESARKHDIAFLECDAIEIDGVRFLGCSLWTDFEILGHDRRMTSIYQAKAYMNDYKHIKISRSPEIYWIVGKYLIPQLTVMRHRNSAQWLESELAKGDPARTVVVTHHAPHMQSIPKQLQCDDFTPAYASDLTRLLGADKSAMWIHGHIHEASDYEVNGTRVICNPLGYTNKQGGIENGNFRMDGLWTI